MIKAFLFDYDGVISQGVDVTLPAKRLAHNVGVTEASAVEIIKSIWDDYSTGKSTSDEIWESIESQLGSKVPTDKRDIWHTWDELKPLPFMLDFVNELQSKGYPVGLVSNVFKETADMIRKNHGYESFSFTILSCDTGYRKPDHEIYRLAMEKLPDTNPDEVLFLDDREHCILGAKDFGLQTIHVTDPMAATEQVRRFIN